MTRICKYEAFLFEDKYKKHRLSSRYWVDNLKNQINYFELCDAFYALCPHTVTLKRSIRNILESFKLTEKLSSWCVENTKGYWMNANFPQTILYQSAANLQNHYWSFQDENDAIIFKLTFS